MGKLLKVWLRLLTEEKAVWFNHPTSIAGLQEAFKKHYEEDNDPQHLMRAFNHAVQYGIAIPQWVIEGLDKRFDKYRPLPEQSEGTEWLTSVEVMNRWKVNDLTLAKRISSKELDYFVRSGKWLSEEAQAVRQGGKVIYQGRTWIDKREITFNQIVQNLDDLAFSMEAVTKFEANHGLIFGVADQTGEKKSDTPSLEEYDKFVRSLRVFYENDSEIKIQEPEKSAKPYGYAPLGFRSPTDKAWIDLLQILQNSDHSYHVGPAYKHFNGDRQRLGDYDKKLRRLDQISDKFIRFVENNFGLQAPKRFKFYEKRTGEKPGTYGLKFQILDGNSHTTDRQLMLRMKYYEKKTKLSQKEKDDLADLIFEVKKRKLMDGENIKDKYTKLVTQGGSYKGDEEIKYDPYENKENLDQD